MRHDDVRGVAAVDIDAEVAWRGADVLLAAPARAPLRMLRETVEQGIRQACEQIVPPEQASRGRAEFDQEKRADIYREIANLLYEDQPYTWLYHRSSFYGFNKKLRGYNFSPRGPLSFSPGFDSIYAAGQP